MKNILLINKNLSYIYTMSFYSDILLSSGASILCSDTAGAITIGKQGQTINIIGTSNVIQSNLLEITDPLITINKGGPANSAFGVGLQFEENNTITGYIKTSSDRNSIIFKAPGGSEQVVNSTVMSTLYVSGVSRLMDSVTLASTLNVSGSSTLNGSSTLTGAVTVGSTLNVSGLTTLKSATTITSTLNVSGNTSINASVDAITVKQGGFLLVPTGCIMSFAGSLSPDGWLLCDGSAVSRTTYATLFAIISTTYGSGNGTTTFNLPNMKGKVPVGYDATQTEFDALGETGGSKTHTLTSSEMPSHTHTGTTNSDGTHSHSITDPGHRHNFTTINDDYNNSGTNPPGFSADSSGLKTWYTSYETTGISIDSGGAHTHTFTTGSTGGGNAHNILQPYIVVNYIIKY